MSTAGLLAQRVETLLGGRARARVVATLAAVLALSAADTATVGAAGPQLEHALGIGRPEIGLLLAVTAAIGALATVPAGMLVDRLHRVSMLTYAVALWGLASGVSAAATSFTFLLLTRIALGVVIAIAAPAVASLLGDFFAPEERSRIYGYVLAGELIGTGFGFLVAGDLAAVSWRAAFLALVPPAAVLVWVLTRLPEPVRGGAGELSPTTQVDSRDSRIALFLDAEPREENVLRRDPGELSLWDAVRYVVRIPSNVVLIVSSALGYFFLAGVRGFGVEFVRHNYSLSQTEATSLLPLVGIGMLVGVLVAGRVADRALCRGMTTARLIVAAIAVLGAVVVLAPALLTSSLTVALPLLMVSGVGMGGANPPLDAARLDVMPAGLWGRAEAVRTLLRGGAQAAAPLVFGVVASDVFSGQDGLRFTFLLSLIPLALSAVLLLTVGRRTYPSDAATARRTVHG